MRTVLGVIVLAWAAGTAADRIVAVPLCGAPSHVFIMWKVCRELADRGHDVKVGIEGLGGPAEDLYHVSTAMVQPGASGPPLQAPFGLNACVSAAGGSSQRY